jgi:sulfate permease, SulP family
MSSAEAFVRVQRLLAAKYTTLVFCGFSAGSPIGKALQSVGVLGAERVELFSTFSDAMECEHSLWSYLLPPILSDVFLVVGTENAYLRAWFRSQKAETIPVCTSFFI